MKPTGKHLIIEASGEIAMLDCTELESVMQKAATATGATVLFSHFHPFGPEQGCTGVTILAESHMSVHTWPEYQYAAFDIFVCGDCNPYAAVEVLSKAYANSEFSVQELKRGPQPASAGASSSNASAIASKAMPKSAFAERAKLASNINDPQLS